ncbi:unnamed protein product [Bemisia tabaci]|uniref:Uncharacterized protein n=1 Tax=Bemisia tabaci TaxID=7038 RepID=A0A9P0F036_BEMTA|nr:unnamed protein product [Bemisia tabaci]
MYQCVVFFLICGTAGAFQDSNENDGLTGLRPLGTAKTNHNAQDEKHRRLREQAKALAQTSDPFDRERLIYIELLQLKDAQEESLKLREESVKTEVKLKEENIRLREEISIILAGNMIEKLEETYGKQFGTEIDRGERWTLMMDLNDPPMLFMSKTANDKGVGIDDLAEIVKKIMRIRDEKVHDQILERKFPNICESFRKDPLACVQWLVGVLEKAYEIMLKQKELQEKKLREKKLREKNLKETELKETKNNHESST